MLVEASCQFFGSGLNPVIDRAFQEISERTVDRLLKVMLAILLESECIRVRCCYNIERRKSRESRR